MSTKEGLVGELIAQMGGADSYAWHRARSASGKANAHSHLDTVKKHPWERKAKTGEAKRAEWINEVRSVMNLKNLNWRDALKEASSKRKRTIKGYKTVEDRTKASYHGRRAADVKCKEGRSCPGKYTKPVVVDPVTTAVIYRPNSHKANRVHLTADAAKNLLREYYKTRAKTGDVKDGYKGATRAMRQDISKRKKTNVIQSPCPTKLITVHKKNGDTYMRRVIDKNHADYAACRSNWLYRATPARFDMETIDYGEGKASPAYGKNTLTKLKEPRS